MTDDIVARLLGDLDSEWQEDVRGATHALAAIGEPAIVPILRSIEQGGERLRRNAALVLKQMHAMEALPHLISLLNKTTTSTENKEILLDVLVSLMEEKVQDNDTDLLDLLLFFSRDPLAAVRRLAVSGLGKIGTSEVLPILRYLLNDEDRAVREECERVLQELQQHRPTGIPPLQAETLAAAARLQVRSQQTQEMSGSSGGKAWPGVIVDLLPQLRDAGSSTLAEMTPLLRQIRDEASLPLAEIVLETKNLLERRIAALRSLEQIHEAELGALFETYKALLASKKSELRKLALQGLVKAGKGPLAQMIAEALFDEEEGVRLEAARLLAQVLTPRDKEQLRRVLDALHDSEKIEMRAYLLDALSCLVDGSPADRLLLLELQPFLRSSFAHEVVMALRILKKLALTPSEALSGEILKILQQTTEPDTYEASLSLLEDILPPAFQDAMSPLAEGVLRFTEARLQDRTYSLLERMADEETIDALLEQAKSGIEASEPQTEVELEG
ncbi:MAG: HEAT repeat domain-containing protein [Myxococcales bacterium]|nr:HEAT repeat domain-containing protein [Myxococcales bacterium]MCB9643030.1 HEAT repeat domain-containing protein [Myxococcales bacterium]